MKLIRREQLGQISLQSQEVKETTTLLQRVFSMRGINHASELACDLKKLHPVSTLKGIDQATQLLVKAFESHLNILIVGDFDADGATSTAVAVKALNAMGYAGNINYLVPNRFEYGYGLTPEIVKEAQKYSPDMIITVDNGISSVKGVEYAKSLGYKVIITDHHLPGRDLPDADAIINPNQVGDDFNSKNLAGVGVIFYLMLSVKTALQQKNYFVENKLQPILVELLDLVALGTVADVVPLDQNNRILVEQGLRRMRNGKACAGIQALFRIAKRNINTAVSSDLGFACGPRLNAAGRLDDMSLGIECLLTTDPQQAMDLASALDDLNIERRKIEEEMKAEALILMKELDDDKLSGELPPVICLYKDSWHQGVIGILAARVRERYNRPAIIFAPSTSLSTGTSTVDSVSSTENEIKGSARSISTLHIRDIFDEVATNHPGLLEKFGGHAMAAGLTLERSQFEEFNQAICTIVKKQVREDTFQEVYLSDGTLEAEDFELKSADALRYAAPWGQHFPAPAFDNRFVIVNKRLLKEKHFKLLLRPEGQSQTVPAIAFNVDIESWPEEGGEVHLLYRLEVNEFRDTSSLQLMVEKLL